MKKIMLLLILLPLIANAGQMDLLRQEINRFIPRTYGLKPPKTEKKLSPDRMPTYELSNIIEQIGFIYRGGSRTAPTLKSTKDDIVIDSTVIIEHDTTICDNIVLINDAQLIIRNCSFFLKGNIYAYHNSFVSVENTDFIILQDFIYQFGFMLWDSAAMEITNSTFNSANFPTSAGVIGSSSFMMDSVDMDGAFVTFVMLGNNSSIDIRHSDKAGEFVILSDSAQLNIAHSDTVLIWLGFPRGSSGELHGSPSMDEWVERFTYPDSTCTGINYSIKVDSLYGLILATMAMDSTDITIYDADLQSAGNIFEVARYDSLGTVIPDTISGLVDDSHYDDWIAPFTGRNLRLVNTSIRAWNLYFYGETNLTLKSSIFGECLSADSNKTTLMQTTCDGFGGHIGATGSSFLITFFTSLYTDALMEGHSVSILLLTNFIFGHLIARDRALSVIYNTILANPILVYDSAAVMVTGLYPPSPAYIDDTLSIWGSATIVRTPDSPFEFEGYRIEYAPVEDTTQFFPLTDRIPTLVDDGELCKFITYGLDVGTYIIRLYYFSSVFGENDSLSFDNTVYLTYKPGVNEDVPYLESSLSIHPSLSRSVIDIHYTIPQSAKVELSIYNICGQEVATLDKGIKKVGEYEIIWNTKNFSDGVYFCRLFAKSFGKAEDELLLTKKFLLLK